MKKSECTKNGFVPVSRLVWSHPDYSLIVSSGLVLHLLMSANRKEGWVVTQTQREIAKMCGLSRQQVRTQLKKLVASGVVKISTEVVRNMRIDQVFLNPDHPLFAALSATQRATQTATQTATQSELLQTLGSEGGANPETNPETNPESHPINKKDNKTGNEIGNKEKKEVVFENGVKEVIALFNEKRLAKHSMRSLSEKVSTTELRTCLKKHGLADCLFVAEHYLGWAERKYLTPANCFRPKKFGNKFQRALDETVGETSLVQIFEQIETDETKNETQRLNQEDTGDDVLNLSSCEDRQDTGADVALLTGGPLGRVNSGRTGTRTSRTHDGIPANASTLQEVLPDVAA